MANITRTETIVLGQTITRETIANLLENALVSSLGLSDLDESAIVVTAASEAPTAALGKWWWDQTEQLMKVYDSTHSLWLAIGPDRRDIAMQNWSGGIAGRGAVASYKLGQDDPRKVTFWTNSADDSDHFIGSWAETTASGAWGPLSVMGFVWLWDDGSPDGGHVNPASYIKTWTAGDGRVREVTPASPVTQAHSIAIARAAANEVYLGLWIAQKQDNNQG
jgi:hypothetical protein